MLGFRSYLKYRNGERGGRLEESGGWRETIEEAAYLVRVKELADHRFAESRYSKVRNVKQPCGVFPEYNGGSIGLASEVASGEAELRQ
jgi:hypothetical protein